MTIGSGQQKISTVNKSIELLPGEEFTIVDRMEMAKVKSLALKPGLLVKLDLPNALIEKTEENPSALLKAKEDRGLSKTNPMEFAKR